jgi:hypothetical protein
MADLVKASGVAGRAADVLLRSAGGRVVMLRLPAPAVPADATEQLGLAVPEFQDVELAPVVLLSASRSKVGASATRALLVSATAVNRLVGSLGFSAASVLFARAYGVLVDGVLLEVVAVTEQEAGGVPYLYRVTLRVPAALVV